MKPAAGKLLESFRAQSLATLEEMHAAAARHDWPALQRMAHGLKGTAGQIGAMAMSAVAAALEQRLRSGGASRPADLARLRETLLEFTAAATAAAAQFAAEGPREPRPAALEELRRQA